MVTEKETDPPDVTLTDDWLVLTTGGAFEAGASVAVTVTFPLE
jgi:hypothetical protein